MKVYVVLAVLVAAVAFEEVLQEKRGCALQAATGGSEAWYGRANAGVLNECSQFDSLAAQTQQKAPRPFCRASAVCKHP